MFFYTLYGNIVKSELELPTLLTTSNTADASIEIFFSPLSEDIHSSIQQGNQMGQGAQISWLNTPYGTFVITHGKYIQIAATGSAQPWELRPFVLGYSMAVLFMQRNILAFHCSTISINGHACIFSGYSGSGKSTTTTTFLKHGALLMADDMVITPCSDSGFMAEPAYPQQKLCADAAVRADYTLSSLRMINEEREKYAIDCRGTFCNHAQPVFAFFLLSPGNVDEVSITKLSESEALDVLLQNLFLAISIKVTGIPQEYLIQCILFSKQIPVYRINRPNNGVDTTESIYSKVMSLLNEF